ncbi:hypothetical protein HW132_21860 [Brasilonema sp. CT11]|nr:hypothetical protein [Brasilonema sp. CT11]
MQEITLAEASKKLAELIEADISSKEVVITIVIKDILEKISYKELPCCTIQIK